MAHNVRAVIFNQDSEFLVLSESDDPDNYKLPGGKIDGDEDPESAIIRELEEELGLSINDYTYQLTAILKTSQEGHNRYIFKVQLKGGSNIQPTNEVADIVWCTKTTVPEGENKQHILAALQTVIDNTNRESVPS